MHFGEIAKGMFKIVRKLTLLREIEESLGSGDSVIILFLIFVSNFRIFYCIL